MPLALLVAGAVGIAAASKGKTTTSTATQTTSNTTNTDSFNNVLNQSLTRNESYVQANSTVNNTALDIAKTYNLANVGNISGGSSGDLASLGQSLDLNKFFSSTQPTAPAISSMDFGGAVLGISDKLKAITGLQTATLAGQVDQTLAGKSDSPTAQNKTMLYIIGLALVAIVAIVWFAKRKK